MKIPLSPIARLVGLCLALVSAAQAALPYYSTSVLPMDADGWSILAPSLDSKLVYVSSSEGDDDNDGLSPSKPKKTLAAAIAELREDSADQLLLKSGDVWVGENLQGLRFKSGRSYDERTVVRPYGDGPRPQLRPTSMVLDFNGSVVWNLAIIGIDFYAEQRDPSSPNYAGDDSVPDQTGFRLIGGGGNFLLEDCRLRFFSDGLAAQPYNNPRLQNIAIRRCIVQHSWLPDSYSDPDNAGSVSISLGMYISQTDGIFIEECVFDQNGFNLDVPNAGPNMFSHDIYLQHNNTDTFVRGNIFTRASAHGIQMRSKGLLEDTFFAQNSISVNFAGVHVPEFETRDGIGRNNVITEGTLMDPNNTSWPRTSAVWAMTHDFAQHAIWSRNIIANRIDSGVNKAFNLAGNSTAELIDNIVYQWDKSVDTVNANWIDPERSAGSYYASALGGENSTAAFIDAAAAREGGEWDPALSAYAVNAYIREGFQEQGADVVDAWPSSRSAHNRAGTTTFEILSNTTWTVSESEDWLAVDSTGNSGPATLTVTYDENIGSEDREGVITLTSGALTRELYVYQQADRVDPFLAVDTSVLTLGGWSEPEAIGIFSNVDWVVETSNTWLHFSETAGHGAFDLIVSADPNTGSSSRRGNFVVRSEDGQFSLSVRVTQSDQSLWHGYSVADDWAYAGESFLGWVYVKDSPWVWDYALNAWIYVSPFETLGTWTYMMSYGSLQVTTSEPHWAYSYDLHTWVWLNSPDQIPGWVYVFNSGGE